MLKVTKVNDTLYVASVEDREGKVLVAHEETSEVGALDFLSALASSLEEGYRYGGVKKVGF